jgi:CBS domain-containing protein
MTHDVYTARPSWSLLDAARVMREKHVSGLPVLDDANRVVGILSECDILADLDRAVGVGSARGVLDLLLEAEGRSTLSRIDQCLRRLEKAHVEETMIKRVVTVDPDASMAEAIRLLRVYSIRRLPVVDGGRLAGIVTRENIVGALG